MTDTPILLALLSVPLLVFVTFFLLAQILSKPVYRRIALGLALGPAVLWAAFGLISNLAGLIVMLSIALACSVGALAWLAGRIVYGRKS